MTGGYLDRRPGRYAAARPSPGRHRPWLLPLACAVLALLIWVGPYTHVGPWARPGLTDIGVYERVVEGIKAGRLPYRDLDLEYPPGAAVLFWLASLVPGHDLTQSFGRLMAVTWAIATGGATTAAGLLGYAQRRQALIGLSMAALPLMLGSLITTRYDAVVTAVVSWLLVAALATRWRWMWGLLIVATLLKIVPAALAPALVIWQAHRTDWRRATRSLALAIAAGVAIVAPVVLWAPDGLRYVVHFHTARGAQIESTASSIVLALHTITGRPVVIDSTFGSQGPVGAGVTAFAQITMVASVLAIVVLVATFVRRLTRRPAPADARLAVTVLASTIVLLVVGSKVLSPQYLLWIVPATLLIPGRRGLAALGTTCATMVATQLYFPGHYWSLVDVETLPIWLLLLRNLLLIALVVLCWPRRSAAAGRA